ncbi:MAG: PDZ domain-containing protein [Solirubrobacteraceae bacterium]
MITSVDGRTVRDPGEVAEAVSANKPGDTIEVTVSDGGPERTVDVEVGTRP